MRQPKSFTQFELYRQGVRQRVESKDLCVRICTTGCRAYGALEVRDKLAQEVRKLGLERNVDVRSTGCHGFCARAPVMAIDPMDIFYQQVGVDDVREIISRTLVRGEVIERLLYHDPHNGEPIQHPKDIPFFKHQVRRVLEGCGKIDPTDITQYIAYDGYAGLTKVLSGITPEALVKMVKDSGLRGRGGAGFPTGIKWELARASAGHPKYLICNADEGDPGAFMDRALLEGDPHRVLEGMILAAYAIGARHGYIYVRAEYPIAVKHLTLAVEQAGDMGLLGENILGTSFSFDLELKQGAGAFVCGEETALMASIEGRRGMPRPRPPFPAQAGLDGKPTNINNVETLANIRSIVLLGPEEYTKYGTENSKGTKIFSLAGKVNNTGLVEVPVGTSMHTVIFDIGGGIPNGRKFKAVQMGGPSGGCVPERYLDLPIDYDSLQAIGSIMGSGGMVVMDENTCMVEIARFFLAFTQSESCGKCVPCRLGTRQMLEILTRITEGRGVLRDFDRLYDICATVAETSLCGLGQTCPKPVLSTLRYFKDEYEAHINEKRCPAGVCDALMISPCQHTCPVGVNVPKYTAHIRKGEYREAVETIWERNPFPAICGRICAHPCESKCRRGELDDPVSIRDLKRFAADWYFENVNEPLEPFPKTKTERVAVVGAGPTGLTAAYHLAKKGYQVTAFEALGLGGGMLMVGVPEYRLPKAVVEKEIKYIMDRGVEIRYNTPINMNYTIEDLRKEGFKAVMIAAGAQKSQRIGIPGEEEGLEGIFYGLHFLRDAKLERDIPVGRKVVAIGGGNVAVDVARSALRLPLGKETTREVHLVCLESRDEMPAFEEEIVAAVEEGVKIHPSLGIKRILGRGGKVVGLETVEVASVFDEDGKFNPKYRDNTEKEMEADTVVFAVGQAPDLSFLPQDSKLERTRWETLLVDQNNLATNIPGIFAGGDFVTGPTGIIDAIAAGRRAAEAMDKHLRGDKSPVELWDLKPGFVEETEDEEVQEIPRAEMPTLAADERVVDFRETELGLSEEQAIREASRCLRCDKER